MLIAPILSIVIPTYKRYDTLIPVLDTFLNWESNNFEVIIQDNTEGNTEILQYLESVKGKCVFKYFHTPIRLSAIENCDLAVSRANGMYVCFIGDDDCVVSSIINLCLWLKDNEIDSLCCNVPLYTWANMQHAVSINNGYNGKLILSDYSSKIEFIDSKLELQKLIKSGAQSLYKVPRLYQGIVSKNVLDQLKQKVKTYFPGPVPDMSNAVALSTLVIKHCYINLPFIIAGHSKKSMSGKNSTRMHQGEIASEKSLASDTAEKWSKKIPFFWSAPTIWSEAAIKALQTLDLNLELSSFNYANVYANCLVFCDAKYFKHILKSIREEKNRFKRLQVYIMILVYIIRTLFMRAKNLIRKILFGIQGIECNDIYSASKYCLAIVDNSFQKK